MFLCISLSFFDLFAGVTETGRDDRYYYYCGSSIYGTVADTAYYTFLLLINICFFIVLLVNVPKKMRAESKDEIENSGIRYKFKNYLLMVIVHIITFIVFYLFIFYNDYAKYIDIIYLSICLAIVLVYNINEITIKEIKKLLRIKEKDLNENSKDVKNAELNEDIIEESN